MRRSEVETELMRERNESKDWPRDKKGDDYGLDILPGKVTYWFDVAVDERLKLRTLELTLSKLQSEHKQTVDELDKANKRVREAEKAEKAILKWSERLTEKRKELEDYIKEADRKLTEMGIGAEPEPLLERLRLVKDELARLREAVKTAVARYDECAVGGEYPDSDVTDQIIYKLRRVLSPEQPGKEGQ